MGPCKLFGVDIRFEAEPEQNYMAKHMMDNLIGFIDGYIYPSHHMKIRILKKRNCEKNLTSMCCGQDSLCKANSL